VWCSSGGGGGASSSLGRFTIPVLLSFGLAFSLPAYSGNLDRFPPTLTIGDFYPDLEKQLKAVSSEKKTSRKVEDQLYGFDESLKKLLKKDHSEIYTKFLDYPIIYRNLVERQVAMHYRKRIDRALKTRIPFKKHPNHKKLNLDEKLSHAYPYIHDPKAVNELYDLALDYDEMGRQDKALGILDDIFRFSNGLPELSVKDQADIIEYFLELSRAIGAPEIANQKTVRLAITHPKAIALAMYNQLKTELSEKRETTGTESCQTDDEDKTNKKFKPAPIRAEISTIGIWTLKIKDGGKINIGRCAPLKIYQLGSKRYVVVDEGRRDEQPIIYEFGLYGGYPTKRLTFESRSQFETQRDTLFDKGVKKIQSEIALSVDRTFNKKCFKDARRKGQTHI